MGTAECDATVSGLKHPPWSVAPTSMIYECWGAEISCGGYTPPAPCLRTCVPPAPP